MCTFCRRVRERVFFSPSFFCKNEKEGEMEVERVGKGSKGRGGEEERRWIRSAAPVPSGASGTPKRFWLWSKDGPSGALSAPGHTNPGPSHIPPFIFLVAKCLRLLEQVCFFSFFHINS